MMKKVAIFLVAFILMFMLCACSTAAPTGFAEEYSPEKSEAPIIPASAINTSGFAIEKHPTSENVEAGGKAKFISYGSTPTSIKWFFTSPSGTDYSASDLHTIYPSLIIDGHNTQTLTLSNIPVALNGFKIYAALTAPDGTLKNSNPATLTVNFPSVKITKHPYSENNIIVGHSTSFIAHAENATSVVWYASKGEKTLLASELSSSECPGIEIYDYDKDKLILRNVPFSVSGWSFFACFDGQNGPIYTEKAIITVISEPYVPTPKCHPIIPCPPPIIPCPPIAPPKCGPCSYNEPNHIVITADTRPSSAPAPQLIFSETVTTVTTVQTVTTSASITSSTPHHCGIVYP